MRRGSRRFACASGDGNRVCVELDENDMTVNVIIEDDAGGMSSVILESVEAEAFGKTILAASRGEEFE